MTVASVKHWQWLAIAALVGLLLWGVTRWSTSHPGRLGDAINDPTRFERALTTRVAGIPAFKEVRVYQTVLEDGAGSSKPVHVVSGKYCDGQIDPEDGKYHWRRTVFVAPIPYKPASHLTNLVKVQASMRYGAVQNPTVVDFLQLLSESDLVDYTNAWWDTHPMLTWFGGSVLLIGVVWPVAINLVVYGKLFRPREEKGIDLSKVRSGFAATATAGGMSKEELDRLRGLEADLEKGLAGGVPTPAHPPSQKAPDRMPAPLVTEAVAPFETQPGEETVFGRKPDDYYPTVRSSGKRPAETNPATETVPPSVARPATG